MKPRPQIFTPVFSSRSVIILALTLRSLIHVDVIFVCGVKLGPNSVFGMGIPVCPRTIIENTILSSLNCLSPFVENRWTTDEGLLLDSQFSPLSVCLSSCW